MGSPLSDYLDKLDPETRERVKGVLTKHGVNLPPTEPTQRPELMAWTQGGLTPYQGRYGPTMPGDIGKIFPIAAIKALQQQRGVPQTRMPTLEEQTRGIREYQPTHAAERTYEEWRPSGIKLPGTENKVLEMEYIAVDMLTGVEVIKRKWNLPVPQDSKSVIAYYSHQILKQLSIGGAFANFHPIVKRYVIKKLFTEEVDLEDPRVLYKLSSIEVQEKLIGLFVNALREKTFIKREPMRKSTIKLSKTSAFVWSKLVYPADKCIFNYVPCDSNYEVDFAKFLDNAGDVEAFTKIVVKNGFYIEYISEENHLRFYYPDFVVKLKNGDYWIIETKGLADLEVPHKDKRATQWCKDTTSLIGENWSYMRVNQEYFERYRFKSVKELFSALN